jgi:alkylation response protein AidB-like acyl-CoA dehydrogenase
MNTENAAREARDRRRRLLASLAGLVADMRARAASLDAGNLFPTREMEQLRALGALSAPLPAAFGGLGMGTEPAGAEGLFAALRLIGRGNLSVGRVIEGHVNALRLIVRHGTEAQARAAAEDALAGHLFGLWVTDAPDAPLRIGTDGMLTGAKAPCSAAGHASRALLTAATGTGETRMVVVRLHSGERADLSGWDAHGMRATGSGRVWLDGLRAGPEDLIGGDGDYLRQPDFSAGAWRTSAVTLGGLDSLVEAMRLALAARGRAADPHQQARIGAALIAQETAALWAWRAAAIGEADDQDAGDVANYVNLARIAVETACLEAMTLTQRALGMAAFRRGTLVELLLRDLSIYLRQPAPDATLTEAAAHFTTRTLPRLPELG